MAGNELVVAAEEYMRVDAERIEVSGRLRNAETRLRQLLEQRTNYEMWKDVRKAAALILATCGCEEVQA